MKQKPYKAEGETLCYINKEHRFSIKYDSFQWILDYHSKNSYYGTFESLLNGLKEKELRQHMELDTRTVLRALHDVEKLIIKVSKDIKIPERIRRTR